VIALLLLHTLVAVALLGAVTHQCVASWRVSVAESGAPFLQRFSAVTKHVYATPVVVLYVANFGIGCVLYPEYRAAVRPVLEQANDVLALAAFEAKEHLAVFGLGLLPGYLVLWKSRNMAYARIARRIVTTLLAFFVWWSFVIGLLVNNISGMST
jgi:hypothetical protein